MNLAWGKKQFFLYKSIFAWFFLVDRSGSCDSCFGPVKNPWKFDENQWRIAGGSSGGSAAGKEL